MTAFTSLTPKLRQAGLGAILSLVLAPIAAPAAAETTTIDGVSHDDAMACSALFALLAASSEGEPEEDEMLELSAGWLIVASRRDGASGDIPNETELQGWVDMLIEELGFLDDDATRERFLFNGIDQCEAKYQLIPDEFEN